MPQGREDLGARFARITRRLIAEETPLLDRRGLTMWEYVALVALLDGPAPTQLELAQAIRYDKTRLIALLDGLADKDLITREPDPKDRRARVVRLTPEGRRRVRAAQRDIHRREDELLADLTPEQRGAFEAGLDLLG